MRRILSVGLFSFALWLVAVQVAEAKRSPPKPVAPVRHGRLEFRAPHDLMGSVEAVDAERGVRAWYRQIYLVERNLDLETDVQDVFITNLKLDEERGVLEVTNERGGVFELELKTFEIKTLKGTAVLRPKK